MSFDNEKFTAWLQDFEKYLIESGMPQRQAMKYRGDFIFDAMKHFANGTSPGDAAMRELLG